MQIFSDNVVEGDWFRTLSRRLRHAEVCRIGPRGSNPPIIEDLVRYDRPDIILLADGRPVLVLEKTREVPTGHNVGQRFARLVRSVESGVPTIKFFPFDARKHGAYTAICNLNARLLWAFARMSEFHQTPVLAVNWPADDHGELLDDGSEDAEIAELVNAYVASGFDSACQAFTSHAAWMESEYERRVAAYGGYGGWPPSVRVVDADDFVAQNAARLDRQTAAALRARPEVLVYTIGMTEEACRREDPYTGTQFIYDYIWCRSGPRPENKSRSLVLEFPRISSKRWAEANPDDPSRKSCNWYLTANALLFRDGARLLRA